MTRLCSASTSTGWVGTADALTGSAKGTPLGMDGPQLLRSEATVPVRVDCAQPGSGGLVGWQAKEANRRCTPFRPVPCLACGADEPPQPAHRARRAGLIIIAGARYDRNRQHARQVAPAPPLVELGHSVLAHQPNKPVPRISLEKQADGVDRIAGAGASLEVADPDAAASGPGARRCEAGGIGRHVLRLVL